MFISHSLDFESILNWHAVNVLSENNRELLQFLCIILLQNSLSAFSYNRQSREKRNIILSDRVNDYHRTLKISDISLHIRLACLNQTKLATVNFRKSVEIFVT